MVTATLRLCHVRVLRQGRDGSVEVLERVGGNESDRNSGVSLTEAVLRTNEVM